MNHHTLRAIVDSPNEDFRTLAEVAGGDPASFYRGANFDGADLRGQDLRGFNLEGATFVRARVDRNTRVDSQHIEDAGLGQRVKVSLELYDFILEGLANCGIILEQPAGEHLGDILDDALFGAGRSKYLFSRAKIKVQDLELGFARSNQNKPKIMLSSLIDKELKNMKYGEKKNSNTLSDPVIDNLMFNNNKLILDKNYHEVFSPSLLEISGGRKHSFEALLSQRTGSYVFRQAKRARQEASFYCLLTIISYAIYRSPPDKPVSWLEEVLGLHARYFYR